MSGSAVYTFTDASRFELAIRAANAKLVSTERGAFRAELTQVEVERLWLQFGVENLPLTVHVSVPPQRAPIFFLARHGEAAMQYAGEDFRPSAILFYGFDASQYQKMPANSRWATMSLTPAELARAASALIRRPLARPDTNQIVTPSAPRLARLRDLHRRARRLARESPVALTHPEVSRALESSLVHAMVSCLSEGSVADIDPGARRRIRIMSRFEEFLASNAGRSLYLTEICQAVGASESTLRRICREQLGMGPNRFLLLRRLHLAQRELLLANRRSRTVTEVATSLGFWELGRFAAAYRAQFEESPLATLSRSADPPKAKQSVFSF